MGAADAVPKQSAREGKKAPLPEGEAGQDEEGFDGQY